MICKDCIHCIHNKVCDEQRKTNYKISKSGCKHFKAIAYFGKIVRCNDCKYWSEYLNRAGVGHCICDKTTYMLLTQPDFYCSHGVRKKQEGK